MLPHTFRSTLYLVYGLLPDTAVEDHVSRAVPHSVAVFGGGTARYVKHLLELGVGRRPLCLYSLLFVDFGEGTFVALVH